MRGHPPRTSREYGRPNHRYHGVTAPGRKGSDRKRTRARSAMLKEQLTYEGIGALDYAWIKLRADCLAVTKMKMTHARTAMMHGAQDGIRPHPQLSKLLRKNSPSDSLKQQMDTSHPTCPPRAILLHLLVQRRRAGRAPPPPGTGRPGSLSAA